MQRDWSNETIESLLASGAIIDHQDGNHGSQYPRVSEFGSVGVPFLTAKLVQNGRLDLNDAPRLGDERARQLRIGFAKPGDVLLSHNATVGRVAIVPEFDGKILLGTSLTYFRLDPRRISARYFAAYMSGQGFQNQLKAVMSQTTRNQVPITAQRRLTVLLPPLRQQEMIADILGTLDDKIELNRRMNETLEAMARALFKSWFVDFDPVRAKAEGRPLSGMDAETAKLFPSEFVESHSGPIPIGWAIGSVYSISAVDYGAPYSSKLFREGRGGRAVIRIRDLQDQMPSIRTDEVHPRDIVVHPGDILVGMDGEFRTTVWAGEIAVLNQRVCRFRPAHSTDATYLRLVLEAPLAFVERTEVATTVIHLGKSDIDAFRIAVPPRSVLDAFGRTVESVAKHQLLNCVQARRLSELRDALLPKLLSGELSVPAAEAALEAIA